MRSINNKWAKEIDKYLRWTGIGEDDMEFLTKEDISKEVAEVVERECREELDKRSKLKLYKENKLHMMQVNDYNSHPSSTLWFRARTNCILLNERNRFRNMETKYELCGADREDLMHFILEGRKLKEDRVQAIELQRPWQQNYEVSFSLFLFGPEDLDQYKPILYEMWNRRNRICKEISGDGSNNYWKYSK